MESALMLPWLSISRRSKNASTWSCSLAVVVPSFPMATPTIQLQPQEVGEAEAADEGLEAVVVVAEEEVEAVGVGVAAVPYRNSSQQRWGWLWYKVMTIWHSKQVLASRIYGRRYVQFELVFGDSWLGSLADGARVCACIDGT